MFGFSSSSVAGFAHAQVLEMVDLAFHFGSVAQQGLDVGVMLGGSGGLDTIVVDPDKDGPPAGGGGAVGAQRAGGTFGWVEAEQQPGPTLVVPAGGGVGG